MADVPGTEATDGAPTYLDRADPAGKFADYYPAWVDNMAADITLEGSMLDGAVQGADAVRAVIVAVRELYDRQDFNFAGPWGDNGFIEDYNAEVGGRPLGCLHLITFNADGQAQHIAAHYRPLSSLTYFLPPAAQEARRSPLRRALPRRGGVNRQDRDGGRRS